MAIRLDLKTGRDKLQPANNPYYTRLRSDLYLGLRVGAIRSTWKARHTGANGAYAFATLADEAPGYSFPEARAAAEVWADALVAAAGAKAKAAQAKRTGAVDTTVAVACRQYVERLALEPATVDTARDADLAFRRWVYGFTCADEATRGHKERDYPAQPLAGIELAKLAAEDVDAWREDMRKQPGQGGERRKPATINRELTRLKAALHSAKVARFVSVHVAAELERVEKLEEGDATRREVYLDRKQRKALRAAATGALGNLIEAAALTGARPGELRDCTRRAFDARTQTLTVPTGKTGRRVMMLSPEAVAFFARMAKDKLPAAPLLSSDEGAGIPWTGARWARPFKALALSLGLPQETVLYSLRHSWITDALNGGMAVGAVTANTGTSLQMIQEHYLHCVEGAAREQLAKIKMM